MRVVRPPNLSSWTLAWAEVLTSARTAMAMSFRMGASIENVCSCGQLCPMRVLASVSDLTLAETQQFPLRFKRLARQRQARTAEGMARDPRFPRAAGAREGG